MKINCLKNIIIACCILLIGCNQEENGMQEDNHPASLSVSFALSYDAQSRGLEDLDDDATVENWEKVVDGRMIYNLAVFLVQGNDIRYRQIITEENLNATKDQATVTFSNLNHGSYILYAVANFNDFSSEYKGALQMNANTITASELLSKTISTIAPSYLCRKNTPYPLTMKKDIVLQPGHNTVEGELVRTYARLRLTVRNQSSIADLKVNSLSLNTNFTNSSAGLFTEKTGASVKPVVNHEDAITKFVAGTTISRVTNNQVTEKVVFDGYLLESTNGNGYQYTLQLERNTTNKLIPIPIVVIDKETGEPITLQAIRRNNLINSLVTVSYNDKYGEFEFIVDNWIGNDNEIEFN